MSAASIARHASFQGFRNSAKGFGPRVSGTRIRSRAGDVKPNSAAQARISGQQPRSIPTAAFELYDGIAKSLERTLASASRGPIYRIGTRTQRCVPEFVPGSSPLCPQRLNLDTGEASEDSSRGRVPCGYDYRDFQELLE